MNLIKKISLTLSIVMAISILVNRAEGKVDPPNYNFSLDALKVFQPNSDLKDIEAKYGKGEVVESEGAKQTLKYYVAHIRYKFPVYVQLFGGKSLGFFAKLPSYFLHDIFHQSLINRYGKQDTYFKQEASAIYQWKNKEGVRHVYHGTCTITCFPVYYSALLTDPPKAIGTFESLLQKFTKAAQGSQ